MCVLFVHMCIMVRVEYTICAHGYQSVYLEGLTYIWVCDKWYKVNILYITHALGTFANEIE